ncbi:MAG: tetratricopeptide repeat protein [Anaeromyxobacteraceae bacterium]
MRREELREGQGPTPGWLPPLLGAAIFALALVVYRATFGFGFVNVDDQTYLTSNAVVQGGLSWAGVRWAFGAMHGSNWHPLTWLSHMADVSLFGMDAGMHHAVSVAIHAVNGVLLLAWLRGATGSTWRSALAAALFAVHPLHVESVAWVAERKDVLSTCFWLVALIAWTGWVRKKRAWRYGIVVVAFALGLLAKPMVVTLPFVLLLVDAWPLGRLGGLQPDAPFDLRRAWPLLREKLPLLALSVASSVVTVVAQREVAMSSLEGIPIGDRLANAVVSVAAYLGQTFWPSGLAAFYPHPSIGGVPFAAWLVVGSAILVLALSVVAFACRRSCPWLPWGWLWFLGTLVPVIGIVQVGVQARADRYTYIPSVGILVAVSWTVGWLAGASRARRIAASAASVAALAALSVAASAQAETWRSSEPLWRHAIAVTERNWAAWAGLGDALHETGRMEESVAAGQQSLRMNPRNARAWNVVGIGLAQLGQMDEAARHLRQAIELDPRYGEAWYNLGISYGVQGDHARAAQALARAAALEPDNPNAWANLAVARFKGGDAAGAEAAMREVERLDPARAAAMRGR